MFEFQSEDLRLLREEIEKGLADLRKVTLIRNECAQLDWFGSNTGRCSKYVTNDIDNTTAVSFPAFHAKFKTRSTYLILTNFRLSLFLLFKNNILFCENFEILLRFWKE